MFITGTDTGVGKTTVACAIAAAMKKNGTNVGVCKPFASGCRRVGPRLVSDDAVALSRFSGCGAPLEVINPIRYEAPLAPAVAAAQAGQPPDTGRLIQGLRGLDRSSDVLLIEGVGGLLAPLLDDYTVLDLIVDLGYPVVVVARAGLGTLNHTAMTVRLLRAAGCGVAGLVVNHYDEGSGDVSVASNRAWLEKMNQTQILTTVPVCPDESIDLGSGRIPDAVLEAAGRVPWLDHCAVPRAAGRGL